jgi:hypothetical protein
VAYILDLSQDLVDQAFKIHDKKILTLHSKRRKQQEEIQKQNGKAVKEKVIHYADLGTAHIKAKNEGIDPFIMLEKVMPWESVEEAKKLSRLEKKNLSSSNGDVNPAMSLAKALISGNNEAINAELVLR